MPLFLRKLWLVLLGGLLSPAAHAQADFRPGYIVPVAGDTVRGRVDYSGGQRNHYQCRFRPGPADDVVVYTPAQLKGYGFPGTRAYQTHRVPLAAAPGDTATRRVFLEVMVRGAVSLYTQFDTNGHERYYAQVGSGPLQPLVQTEAVVDDEGQAGTRKRALFRGILSEIFRPCPAVQSTVGSIVLQSTSLVKAVRQYNDCVGGGQQGVTVAQAKGRHYLGFEALAGAQTSTLLFHGDTPVQEVVLWAPIAPVLGVAAQLHSTVSANRLNFRVEAFYERQRYDQEYSTAYTFPYAANQEVRIHLDRVRVPLLFRYSPLDTRLRPFVEAGFSFAVALNSTNEFRYRGTSSAVYSRWLPILPNPRPVEEGWVAGLGVNLPLANRHNLGAAVRAERTNGMSEAIGIETVANRFYFLLSYSLSNP